MRACSFIIVSLLIVKPRAPYLLHPLPAVCLLQIVVAVVVPMGSVLLAALVGSIWWVRRNRRRELEQQQPQQRAKAGGGNAANAEAGGAQEKAAGAAAGGGVRLGVLRGGVRNGDDGVFLGVDGEKDLPQWSEAAHFEGVSEASGVLLLHTVPKVTTANTVSCIVLHSSSSATPPAALVITLISLPNNKQRAAPTCFDHRMTQ